MAVEDGGRTRRHALVRYTAIAHWRASRLDPVLQALLWSGVAGLIFTLLNALVRALAMELHPFQAQFLRYLFSLIVMLPLVVRSGLVAWRPRNIGGQFGRGAVHAFGLTLWFIALPNIPLAETTAIAFTGPIFIMVGAALMFGEKMRWERWLAALLGLGGVLIVVAPNLLGASGGYSLLMLSTAPIFAVSFLLTKGMTRYERPAVIVLWQAISVTAISLPLALMNWRAPTAAQWFGFLVCGILGSVGQYLLARAFSVADISASQSVKFLDLVWASLLGWLIFADRPSQSTLIGGGVICASTLWIARREARGNLAR